MRQKRLRPSRQSMCVYALLTSTCTVCSAPTRTEINAFCLLHYFDATKLSVFTRANWHERMTQYLHC